MHLTDNYCETCGDNGYIVECSNGSISGRMSKTGAIRCAKHYVEHAIMRPAWAWVVDAEARKPVAGFGATKPQDSYPGAFLPSTKGNP